MNIKIIIDNKIQNLKCEILLCLSDNKEYTFFPDHIDSFIPLINATIWISKNKEKNIIENKNGILIFSNNTINIILN